MRKPSERKHSLAKPLKSLSNVMGQFERSGRFFLPLSLIAIGHRERGAWSILSASDSGSNALAGAHPRHPEVASRERSPRRATATDVGFIRHRPFSRRCTGTPHTPLTPAQADIQFFACGLKRRLPASARMNNATCGYLLPFGCSRISLRSSGPHRPKGSLNVFT